MALIAFTSAKGAPGVTTAALAFSFAWHRPSLVVEADMAAASSILSGYLQASTDHSRGLPGLSLANRNQGLTAEALWDQVLKLGEGRYLLPGLADPAQAAQMTTTWTLLADLLADLATAGIDVLIDAGRLGAAYGPNTLLHRCDAVILVTSSRLDHIYALARRTRGLIEDHMVHGGGASIMQVLVVGEGRPYSSGEIEAAVKLPVLSAIAWDPACAEVYSSGAQPGQRFSRSDFASSINAAAAQLTDVIDRRRNHLSPRSSPIRDRLSQAAALRDAGPHVTRGTHD